MSESQREEGLELDIVGVDLNLGASSTTLTTAVSQCLQFCTGGVGLSLLAGEHLAFNHHLIIRGIVEEGEGR